MALKITLSDGHIGEFVMGETNDHIVYYDLTDLGDNAVVLCEDLNKQGKNAVLKFAEKNTLWSVWVRK